jgi:hypothetical protein
MADADDPHFDRRTGDVNVAALATRMNSLEGRVEVLEEKTEANNRELRANTRLTMQVHEALFGREGDDDDPGIRGKVKEMHDVFTGAKRGLQFLNSVADAGARYGKPILYLVLICGAVVTFVKTGDFKWPGWPS